MIRRHLWLVFILCFSSARADIFEDNKDAFGRDDWKKAAAKDSYGLYYRNGFDDQSTSALSSFEYGDQNVPDPPLSAFDFKDDLFNQIWTPLFDRIETEILMQRMIHSPLMLWQYSSPAGADLFKHYQIAGNLRLDRFYRQMEDIQRRTGGDLGVLSDQARMECLEDPKLDDRGKPDLVKTMLFCSQGRLVFDASFADIMGQVLGRLHVRGERKDMITAIMPKWVITPNGYEMNGPVQRIGNVFSDYRDGILEKLYGLMEQYRRRQSVDPDDLRELSLPGLPLTDQSLRDWLTLEASQADLVLGKIASQLARVKTMEQYDMALEFLNRALIHPSIREGHKMITRQALEFIVREKNSLASYRAGLGGYATVLGSVADVAEKRRLEIIRDLNNDNGDNHGH
ncbi:MAG: hypothetical protein Q7K71_04725 [Candidatus Omnitrophota bacterium]|nr:hypothetical protein [Candidatus Omnitrophota bacterium]